MRQRILLMLSLLSTCVAAVDAQEFSQFNGLYYGLCNDAKKRVWYGERANNAWNLFSSTYSNNLDSNRRFYGEDITVTVPVAKNATIIPSELNKSDVDWSSRVPGVTIIATIPFDRLTTTSESDNRIILEILPNQEESSTITATIPAAQLSAHKADENMAATGIVLPIEAFPRTDLRSLAIAALLMTGETATALPIAFGDAAAASQYTYNQNQLAATLNAGCMASHATASGATTAVQFPHDQLAAWLDTAGDTITAVQFPIVQPDAWFDAASNAITAVQIPYGQLDAALKNTNAAITAVQIPNEKLKDWRSEYAADDTNMLEIPYNKLSTELNTSAAVATKLHLEGIFRNCSTPDPSFFWEQFLIRSKGEMVICQ